MVKIWAFDATRGRSRQKKPSDINFTNGVVAQRDVSVIKATFVSDSTLIEDEF